MTRPPITRARPWTPSSGAFAGQTFNSERQYRNALARRHGFRSWAAQQAAAGPPVRGPRDASRLRPSEREAHQRAGTVLSEMRRDPSLSLSRAARRVGTTPEAVKRHAGSSLARAPRGRYLVAPTDTHYRRLRVVTPHGVELVATTSSRDASLVGAYDSAVEHFLRTGDDSRLAPFRDRSIRSGRQRYRFLVDLDPLEELGERGELSFESIYES